MAADGRFSPLARRLGAGVVEEHADKVSTVYFADWSGVAPLDAGHADEVQIHAAGRGLNVLFFPLPGGRTTVCVHVRADRAPVEGDAQGFYRRAMEGVDLVPPRLAGAEQVSKLLGMKRVGNGYREAAGPGWFLVGDALHYKDPVDGQGIYDALLEGRILARLIAEAAASPAAERGLAARYRDAVREATRPMYLATVGRLAGELYTEPPELAVRTALRWMLTDPVYQDRFMRFLCRVTPVGPWPPPSLAAGSMLRGAARDLAGLLRR